METTNGYEAIAGGTCAIDPDNDVIPDAWEMANGTNPAVSDAMTKAAGGYGQVEHHVNWLAGR